MKDSSLKIAVNKYHRHWFAPYFW